MSGDGKRFKGRGPIQLTGRSNYKKFGDLLGIDLISNPDRASDKDIAFRTAGLFWKLNGLNQLADRQWYMTITKRINGGFNGLDDRVKHFERALTVLGVARMRGVETDPADDSGIPRFSRGLDGDDKIVPTAEERNPGAANKPASKPAKKAAKKVTAKEVARNVGIKKAVKRVAVTKAPKKAAKINSPKSAANKEAEKKMAKAVVKKAAIKKAVKRAVVKNAIKKAAVKKALKKAALRKVVKKAAIKKAVRKAVRKAK